MPTLASRPGGPAPGLVHGLLALTVVSGFVVRMEPAPYDLAMVATVGLGSLVVLPRLRPSLVLPGVLVALLLLANAISLTLVVNLGRGVVFFGVTAYLALSAAWIAGWLERDRTPLLRTLLHAYALAALLGGALGVAAYFGLGPGAAIMVPKGRLQGLFKDANVLGAFMVPAVVLAAARMVEARPDRLRWIAVGGVGLLAVLSSYSRGAWINLAISLLAYVGLRVLSGRARASMGVVVGAVLALGLLVMVMDHPTVHAMLEIRASTQGYDDDRFANQAAGLALALEHPWGVGPGATEGTLAISAHSLYVRALMENGVLGLWSMAGLVGLSLARASWAATQSRDPETSRLLAVVAAALAGAAVESAVIDTVHWRHLWLLLAMAWAPRQDHSSSSSSSPNSTPTWSTIASKGSARTRSPRSAARTSR
ncbi:O-antigen ligase family protein [Paraliomyxa miuraensis]|uniref:O-antigen ligase family protein n=1 Tax=Paraliomyxa miuraensis TaxID=376150 RepID=UPI00225C2C6F|nr:O-antigen ligase family protein [Paraliomyxa miuraensis]MCX4246334.1 O-antigen ligase family protein [Paraliomyxa miuraensis]